MSSHYTWEIRGADKSQNSLLVEYSLGSKILTLNLPYPSQPDIENHIRAYAPVDFFSTVLSDVNVEVGQRGDVPIEVNTLVNEDAPNMVGNLNEEYIRSLIYQVMEEIRESSA